MVMQIFQTENQRRIVEQGYNDGTSLPLGPRACVEPTCYL